jgi:hypothetical protein
MSWSIDVAGNPENVAAALRKHGDGLTGQSRVEFDEARPHLEALVSQNFVDRDHCTYSVPMIHLSASGSGTARKVDGADLAIERSCAVKIERVYLNLV